jgi:hypothetical protein
MTWGIRKKFSEDHYSVGYSHFLGYDKNMNVNPEEADVVCMTNLSAEIRLLIFCPDGTIRKMEFSLVLTCIPVYNLK